MERKTMERQIETYMTELQLAIHHPILERDVGVVNLARAKVFFLLLPKLNGETWTDAINTAALSVGAVYAGFEAHDVIDKSDATSTKQQLTVLSGDYFSGTHYKLLASIPDFDFIRTLSHTIGRVHEMKAENQNYLPVGTTKILDAVRTIEASCITAFLHKFGFTKYIPIVDAALPLLALESENLYKREARSALGWALPDSEIENVISTLREETSAAIAELNFISPFLKQEISDISIQFLGKPI